MKYCKNCLEPDSRPGAKLSSKGNCSTCKYHFHFIENYDENERAKILNSLIKENMNNKKNEYFDCIIGVSGGKDSHFQAWYFKELGLNPLLFTYYTHNYSETGEANLTNIRESLGLDHYVFYPNKHVIKKMNKIGFNMTGDMSWHFHCGVWTLPFQFAVKFNIPLLIYGEHGFLDLVGQYSHDDFPEFTKRQRNEDMMRGFSEDDFVGKKGLTEKDLLWARYPSDEDIERVGIRGLFMGNYVYWDANKHLTLAKQIGFKENPVPYERTYRKFSNVDDIHENGIKDYLKFIKFGYGRCTDHTSKDIRLGHMTREEGVKLVLQYDHVLPRESLQYFLDMAEISEDEFEKTADNFRDPRVWWIQDGKWWKDTLNGVSKSYGDVKLSKEKQIQFLMKQK